MKVHYPKLYNTAHFFSLNVFAASKDITIIFYLFDFLVDLPDVFLSCVNRVNLHKTQPAIT